MKILILAAHFIVLTGCSRGAKLPVTSPNRVTTKIAAKSYPIINGEVQVALKGRLPFDSPQIPAQTLSQVLRDNAKAKLFRLTWESGTAGFNYKSSMLYDRQLKTLKYFSSSLGRDIDGKGAVVTEFRTHHSHITEAAIHQLVALAIDPRSGGFAKPLLGGRITLSTRETHRKK